MLEAGGVGGVAGDGALHALQLHNGHAFQHIVCAVALHSSALAFREGHFLYNLHFAGLKVKLGLHIGKAIDTADDIGSILAQAVQNHAQGFGAHLVGSAGNADSAFCGGKAFVACQEAEALGILVQQHCAQIAMAQAHLALLGHRAGNGKGLQALANGSGAVRSALEAALYRNSGTQRISPNGIVKADGLHAANDLVAVDALCKEHLIGGIQRFQPVCLQAGFNFGHTAIHRFKSCHVSTPLLFFAGVNVLHSALLGSKAAVSAHILLIGFLGVLAVADVLHHFAKANELVADHFVVGVQSQLLNIALRQLQIAHTLLLGGENGAGHAAQALAQVIQACADGQAVLRKSSLAAAVNDLQKQLAHGHVDGIAHQVGVPTGFCRAEFRLP